MSGVILTVMKRNAHNNTLIVDRWCVGVKLTYTYLLLLLLVVVVVVVVIGVSMAGMCVKPLRPRPRVCSLESPGAPPREVTSWFAKMHSCSTLLVVILANGPM